MVTTASKGGAKQAQPERISWEDFQAEYLTREDAYKYEWLDGIVEKTERAMNQNQFFILQNLLKFFRELLNAGKASGELISEGDTFFLENHRRPDISYFTNEQIARAARGENQVPQFVIEIISKNDVANKVQAKVQDYQRAEVQVIWHLYPELEEVHIYHGKQVTICSGDDLCSAAPVLPAFELRVNAIFQKPEVEDESENS